MPKVLLKDVVDRIKDRVDKDNTYLEYYIGGEHFDYGEICVTKRGMIKGSTIGPAFHMRFMPGDVLLMSRNPHLRKAGMVDFEGLCSDVSYVCRTKNDKVLLQSYLPFIFQSDHFWSFAEQNKHGSTNYFLNWTDFEKYEFELPCIDEQKKLSNLLWSIQKTRSGYQNLLLKTDELVKSQFIEMFGDPMLNPYNWDIVSFSDVAEIDAVMTTDYQKYAEYPHIGIDSIEKDTGIISGYRTVREDNVISGKYLFTAEHIIYSKIRPNLNKVATPSFSGLCSADAYPIKVKNEICCKMFFAVLLRSNFFLEYILGFSNRSQMPKVNRNQIQGFKFPLPPIELQRKFELIIKQTDKSKLIDIYNKKYRKIRRKPDVYRI